MTIGASGDHLINCYLLGASEVVCFDVNVLTEYFVELKLAALKKLSYKQFLDFLMRDGSAVFDFQTYGILCDDLSSTARFFWDKVYAYFKNDGKNIRESFLFSLSNDDPAKKMRFNLYLKDEKSYKNAQKAVQGKFFLWINQDLKFGVPNEFSKYGKFDFVFLSNVSDFAHLMFNGDYLKAFVDVVIKPIKRLFMPEVICTAYLYNYEIYPNSVRNKIDDPDTRKQKLVLDGYESLELNFPAAYDENVKDTLAYFKRK